ncbi:MAG: hypothetical protein ACJAYU_001891 [Bradymonadia bacterium]|jgi:hypothetical protein
MNRIIDSIALFTAIGGVVVAIMTVRALAELQLLPGLGGILLCAVLLRTSSQLALTGSVRSGAAR